MRKRVRRIRWAGLMLLGVAALLLADHLFPLPPPGRDAPYALVVVSRDATPLRAFPDRDHVWRYPIGLDEVSPLYLEALVGYEDRAFWWHPGVNPFALLRAGWQRLSNGRVVSGGSTLTMQVARILDPTHRSFQGKLRQIARALQLEWHYSKREILSFYLNYAPMGGVLEGVEAASRAYLGKPAKRLSHAEAALLTVLPQGPSLLRPDRYLERARAARDKVLRRMEGHWGAAVVADAMKEPAYAQALREPMLAPLLAERLRQAAQGRTRIDSTIDAGIQAILESLLADRARNLPPRVSVAALVMDNATLEVLAYLGSADFEDQERASHIDMVRSARSPGSALKPFLYGFALDDALIHSESLLADAPQSFSGYQPGNFQQSFHGPVSVSEALIKSLNVPAVEVLERLDPVRFVSLLRRAGVKLAFPRGAGPNLSVILGGAGTTLEELVGAYSSFARKGVAGKPRLTRDAPVEEARVMSEGAAFIVRDILEAGAAGQIPDGAGPVGRGIAWKTGTSFGFRDAWAVGVSDHYTVGVWIGRPDGTPNPGHFGANAAVPMLVDIYAALPAEHGLGERPVPPGVTRERICWPLGTREAGESAGLCQVIRTAWVLGGAAPPTFPDRLRSGEARYTYYLDEETGRRVLPGCTHGALRRIDAARWPATLEPWLDAGMKRLALPPAWSPECARRHRSEAGMKIVGVSDGEVIRRASGEDAPIVRLEIRGHDGEVNWMVNGRMTARSHASAGEVFRLAEAGRYDITAFDDQGHYDRVSFSVTPAP